MKLLRYKQFNEGIISKGLELINSKEIKESDKIAQKYLDMIYKDYEKKKSLLAVKISNNKGYKKFWYKITEDPYGNPSTSGGEYDYIIIELTSINEMGWSDITRARFGAEISQKGSRTKNIVGRDMKTNKLIFNENGINEEVYDYVNVSQGPIEKIINFFTKEYISKYPQLKGSQHLNSMKIMEIDKKFSEEMNLFYKNKHEKSRKEHDEKHSKLNDIIEKTSFYKEDDLMDYFLDIKEFFDEKYNASPKVDTVLINNGRAYKSLKIMTFKSIDTHGIDVDIQGDKILYAIKFLLNFNDDFEIDTTEYDIDGEAFNKDLKKEVQPILDSIGLPDDLKIIECGLAYCGDGLIKKIFGQSSVRFGDDFIILIEQLS